LREPFLRLRQATDEDCRLIWEWANDRDVRKVSFTPEPIPWADHVRWFAGKLREAGGHFWIACVGGGQPVGQVRFDEREGKTVISINLGPEHRGRNLGSLVIWLACRKLFRDTGVKKIRALIKPDNPASVRAFEKAGFGQVGATVVNHQPALVFELSKDRAEP
jgi:RimJ/RimL family protein N-acetyltransferase